MAELARSATQLGAVIRRKRRKRALTQKQVGELAGIRQASISKIENGNLYTQLDTILRVLAALDLELTVDNRSKGSAISFEDIF